jgi:ankyrin repeat protein
MAEALGVASALLGTCDIILRASSSIISYISSVQSAPEDLKRVCIELECLESMTRAVKGFLQSTRARRHSFDSSTPIYALLNTCAEFIKNLKKEFQKKKVKSRLLWPLWSKEWFERSIQELCRFSNLFHLAMSLTGWDLYFEDSATITDDLRQIRQTLDGVMKGIRSMSDLQEQISNLQQGQQAVECMVVACAETVLSGVDEVKEKIEQQEKRLTEEKYKREKQSHLDFISDVDLSKMNPSVIKSRQPGTSSWLMDVPQFQEWLSRKPGNALWCHGMPGCGKTVIFSAVVDYLTSQPQSDLLVGTVYLSYREPTLHSADAILSGLLRNIAEQVYDDLGLETIISSISAARRMGYEKHMTSDECIKLLSDISNRGKRIILCFDALDEVPHVCQAQLLQRLAKLQEMETIKIFLMSRDNISTSPLRCSDYRIETRDSDIRTFLNAHIDASSPSILSTDAIDDPLRKETIESVIKKANGSFLMADLQIRELVQAVSLREMREQLARLPEQLDDQYMVYINRIKSSRNRDLALDVLRWLHGSYRSLTADELIEAISIRPGDTDIDESGFTTTAMIMRVTAGLVHVDSVTKIVSLVHETFQDFLGRKHDNIFGDTHGKILHTLASYLDFNTFGRPIEGVASSSCWMETGLLEKNYRLLTYACLHWNHHLRISGTECIGIGQRIVEGIAEAPLLNRLVTRNRLPSLPTVTMEGFTPLHFAALYKCLPVAMRILESKNEEERRQLVNSVSDEGLTALHICASLGDVNSFQFFLGQSADPAIQDYRGRTALYTAAASGNIKILDILLDGSERSTKDLVNVADSDQLSPLHIAIANKHKECVKRLLTAGSRVNVTTSSGQTPLHYAIQYCPEVVDDLLSRGSSAELVSKNGNTTLHWVCLMGLQNLIERFCGIEGVLDARNSDGQTPFHLLADTEQQCLDGTNTLLQKKACPNVTDNEGRIPLHMALQRKHYDLAQLLIDCGSQVDATTSEGICPVLLVARDPDCPKAIWNAVYRGSTRDMDRSGSTYLHQAVQRQSAAEVLGLLERGVPAEVVDNKGETPLHLACRLFVNKSRHTSTQQTKADIISVLLHGGANPNTVSAEGFTPLHIAVVRNSATLLGKLVQSRVGSPYTKFPSGESVLQYAVQHCSNECVTYLLPIADLNEMKWTLLSRLLPSGHRNAGAMADFVQQLGVARESPKKSKITEGACAGSFPHQCSCETFLEFCRNLITTLTAAASQEYPLPAWKEVVRELADLRNLWSFVPLYNKTPAASECSRILEEIVSLEDSISTWLSVAEKPETPKSRMYTWRDSIPIIQDSSPVDTVRFSDVTFTRTVSRVAAQVRISGLALQPSGRELARYQIDRDKRAQALKTSYAETHTSMILPHNAKEGGRQFTRAESLLLHKLQGFLSEAAPNLRLHNSLMQVV